MIKSWWFDFPQLWFKVLSTCGVSSFSWWVTLGCWAAVWLSAWATMYYRIKMASLLVSHQCHCGHRWGICILSIQYIYTLHLSNVTRRSCTSKEMMNPLTRQIVKPWLRNSHKVEASLSALPPQKKLRPLLCDLEARCAINAVNNLEIQWSSVLLTKVFIYENHVRNRDLVGSNLADTSNGCPW